MSLSSRLIKTEEIGFKKDENPYVIFACFKCKQYMYVKTVQKGKKCLRCGRNHKVSSVIDNGEIINGITDAVNLVKQKQNEFAIKEIGGNPDFRSSGDFISSNKIKFVPESKKKPLEEIEDYSFEFKRMLVEISTSYKSFPYYIIEMLAEEYKIPSEELKNSCFTIFPQRKYLQIKR